MSKRTDKLAELNKELADLITPVLTFTDHEDVSDRYQEALEIGWEKDGLRDQIEDLENMTDEEYNQQLAEEALIHQDDYDESGDDAYYDQLHGQLTFKPK